MRVLDAFCCEGGGAWGYHQAGFEVVGVDIKGKYRKRYPFEFVEADAVDYIAEHGHEFDLIHASPPCQGYTQGNAGRETRWPKLIGATRAAIPEGVPYVIENVKNAEIDMIEPVGLCGCMFDLSAIDTDGILLHMQRMRMFETNWGLTVPRACDHSAHDWVAGSYDGARRDKYQARFIRKGGYVPRDKGVVKTLLGIEHDMTWNALYQSIPPAYTKWIGSQWMERQKEEN